ncbi:MAG: glycosyltransferase, partial [Dysgonamonadaceae bacterium]
MNVQKKIKVAFFTDILIKDFDGAIKTMYQLIDRIPKDRFEYMFFCGTAPKHDFKYKVYKVPSIVIPFNISYKLALPGLRKNTLLEKLDEFKPDVIHISTPSIIGFYALNYAQRNGIRVLSIYHTHFISYIKYYFKHLPFLINPLEKVISDYYRKIYNNCDIVYVPTQFMINELVEVSGVDRKQ